MVVVISSLFTVSSIFLVFVFITSCLPSSSSSWLQIVVFVLITMCWSWFRHDPFFLIVIWWLWFLCLRLRVVISSICWPRSDFGRCCCPCLNFELQSMLLPLFNCWYSLIQTSNLLWTHRLLVAFAAICSPKLLSTPISLSRSFWLLCVGHLHCDMFVNNQVVL